MTLLAQSGVCRRTVISAGAALFAAPHVMANEVIDSRAATLVDAVNLEDQSALLTWATETISADGLRRRSAEAFASLLAASRVGTGRWHLLSTESDARRVRATIRLADDAGVRRIDLLIDPRTTDCSTCVLPSIRYPIPAG